MSIKKMLSQASSTLQSVKLSEIAQKHRLAHYTKQLASTPFGRSVKDFVESSMHGVLDPHEPSVQKAQHNLRAFLADNEYALREYESDGMQQVDLTKRWITANNTASDLVALARTPQAPMDAAVVTYMVTCAKEAQADKQNYIICEMAHRLLTMEQAQQDPRTMAAFVNAVATLPVKLTCMHAVVGDMVKVSNAMDQRWPETAQGAYSQAHVQLKKDLTASLTSIANMSSERLMCVVAQCAQVDVQKAVLTVADRVGIYDPKLSERVHAIVDRGNHERQYQRERASSMDHGYGL